MNDQQPGNGAQTQRHESPSPEGQRVISILPPTEGALIDWMNDRIRYWLSIPTATKLEWDAEEWANHRKERRALIAWLNHGGRSYTAVREYFLNFEDRKITEQSSIIQFLDKIELKEWATVDCSNIDEV